MADPFSPVAANSIPPDPNGGLNTLSKIMGIRAQKQALVGQQADVQQKVQDASQRQAAASYFKNMDFTNHVGADGTLDLNTALKDPDLDKTGDAKPQIIQGLLAIKNKQLDNASALMRNNSQAVTGFGEAINSLKGDEDVKADNDAGRAKTQFAIQQFGKQGPDQARIAEMYAPVVQHAPQGKLPGALNAIGLQAQNVAQQQSQQNQQPANVDAGDNIIQQTIDPQTGKPTNVGILAKGLPPTITPNSAGKLTAVTGGGKQVSVIPSAPGENANPSAAEAIAQKGQASAVTDRVSQALGQANNTVQAQDALSRAKAILESPESPKTGANFESLKNLRNTMSSMGIDTKDADDMNTLAKNLARFEAARATASGLGGTDAARELAHAGSPNTSLDNKAALAIVNQSLAAEKALQSYAKVQSKTNDPQALLKNESDFRNIPHLVEAHEFGMTKNAAEANAYLKAHDISPAQMKASRAAIKEFDSR